MHLTSRVSSLPVRKRRSSTFFLSVRHLNTSTTTASTDPIIKIRRTSFSISTWNLPISRCWCCKIGKGPVGTLLKFASRLKLANSGTNESEHIHAPTSLAQSATCEIERELTSECSFLRSHFYVENTNSAQSSCLFSFSQKVFGFWEDLWGLFLSTAFAQFKGEEEGERPFPPLYSLTMQLAVYGIYSSSSLKTEWLQLNQFSLFCSASSSMCS